MQFGGKKKFTPLHLELSRDALVLREPEGRSALRTATAVGCAVAELKNSRKGHPFAWRVDLARNDSAGDSKYVLSVEREDDKAEWMQCLAAHGSDQQSPMDAAPVSPSKKELKAARKSGKRAEKEERKAHKQEAKAEAKQQKTDAKMEKKQGKLEAKQAKRHAKQDAKQAKRDAKEAKKAAKEQRKAAKKSK